MVWFHAYGSYMSKYAPVVAHFTEQGYEVVGFDMRGFGESEGERSLIADRRDWIDDAQHFLSKTHEWQLELRGYALPWIAYGYSMGGCYALGTYLHLERLPRLQAQFKSMVLVVPNLGMGDYWWGRFPPDLQYRHGYLRTKYIDSHLAGWPALMSKRDRHDELHYRGRVLAPTLWMVHEQILSNDKQAHKVKLPLHVSVSEHDPIVSSEKTRNFFNRTASAVKTLKEYDGKHDLLA